MLLGSIIAEVLALWDAFLENFVVVTPNAATLGVGNCALALNVVSAAPNDCGRALLQRTHSKKWSSLLQLSTF